MGYSARNWYNDKTFSLVAVFKLVQNLCPGVIPKSVDPLHIAENIDLNFDLEEKDIVRLNSLNKKIKYAWDPSIVV